MYKWREGRQQTAVAEKPTETEPLDYEAISRLIREEHYLRKYDVVVCSAEAWRVLSEKLRDMNDFLDRPTESNGQILIYGRPCVRCDTKSSRRKMVMELALAGKRAIVVE